MNLLKFRKPSRYIDSEINVIRKADAEVRVALAFPDIYDIGMSHLGFKILYDIINSLPYAAAERVFAPWTDLREYLAGHDLFLSSLEFNTPLKDFHIVGFSLQYELSYPTIIDMLSLGGIPIYAEDRDDNNPVVVAGGPCSVNPSPLSPFIDAFLIGDGEEAVIEFLDIYRVWLRNGGKREELLKVLADVDGFYVPKHSTSPVKRRFIKTLDEAPFPSSPVVPFTQIVHDRVNVEISRGCTRGCRFCQAGTIYRPLRERSPEKILKLVDQSLSTTGYDEISFTSLSTGDYSQLLPLLKAVNRTLFGKKIAISLPSLRVGAVNRDLLREIKRVKKTGFTIAPEAATERLRRVINKDFNEDDYEKALHALFGEGWLNLKLYFMIGLPTERDDDIEAIPGMVMRALQIAKRYTGRYVNITVGISPFVPKPHTPFQWSGQEPHMSMNRKIKFLNERLPRKGINLKVHNLNMSLLEAALSRGGEKCADIIKNVHDLGAYLDSWSEQFDFSLWEKAMERSQVNIGEIATLCYRRKDILPWDIVDTGIKKKYLYREYERAINESLTTDCNMDRCHACGLGCKSGEFLTSSTIRSRYLNQEMTRRFSPVKVRVQYAKKNRLRYLSHIEITNSILRGFRRAGMPLVHTAGFSPSPKVSFGPPLNVGISGEKEYLDIDVNPPFDICNFADQINRHLPDGLEVRKMVFVYRKVPSLNSFITMYEYIVNFNEEKPVMLSLFKGDRRKFSDFIEGFDIIEKRKIRLRLKDLQGKKVKLSSILESLFGLPLEGMSVVRTGLYGWEKGWIDPMEQIRNEA